MTHKPDEYLGCGDTGCIIEPARVGVHGGCDCLAGMDPDKRVKLRKAIARDRNTIETWKARCKRYENHMADNVPTEHWPEMQEPP